MNIAMISAWHVHSKEYAQKVNKVNGCKVVAVWDDDILRGKAWANELSCAFESDLDKLLADESIDAVVITTPTSMHKDIMIKAANAKKHIFTEKVLTLTKEDAYEVMEAVKKNGIHFAISFPKEAQKELLALREIVLSGKLGTVTYARVRNCHDGSVGNWLPDYFYDKELCGGGAMIDLGAHPMYLLAWVLGTPVSISSHFTSITKRPVEDNAVSLITFENGAVGVSETGFVSTCDPFIFEVSGTKGYAVINGREIKYRTVDNGKEWIKPDLNLSQPSPIEYFCSSVMNDTENNLYTIEEAVTLSCMMDAAYRSYNIGSKAEV